MNKLLESKRKSTLLFIIVFITYAIIYMTKNCYSAAMASIVKEGVMTKTETGMINAVFYLVYGIFQVFGGIAADKVRPDLLIFIGMIGAGGCNLAVYFFDDYIALLIIQAINAVLQFGIWPAIFKIVATNLAYEVRPMAIFLISVSSSAGLVLSYVSAAFITEWKASFLFSAISLFVTAFVFLLAYLLAERDMKVIEEVVKSEEEPKPQNAPTIIIRSGLPIICIVYVISSMLNLGIKALAPTMLSESYADLGTELASVMNIALVVAGPVGLCLANFTPLRKIVEPLSITILFGVSIPILILPIFVGKVDVLLILLALVLLMVALGAMSIFYSFISRAFLKFNLVGTVSGILNCMAALGIVLANSVFAVIADAFDWRITALWWLILAIVGGVLAAIAIPIFNRFKEEEKIV